MQLNLVKSLSMSTYHAVADSMVSLYGLIFISMMTSQSPQVLKDVSSLALTQSRHHAGSRLSIPSCTQNKVLYTQLTSYLIRGIPQLLFNHALSYYQSFIHSSVLFSCVLYNCIYSYIHAGYSVGRTFSRLDITLSVSKFIKNAWQMYMLHEKIKFSKKI